MPIQIVSDGDAPTASNFNATAEAVIDDLAYLATGDTQFTGNKSFLGTTTFESSGADGKAIFEYDVRFDGEVAWRHTTHVDSDANINAETPVWIVPTLTGHRTYTLTLSGPPQTGARTRVVKLTTPFTLTIKSDVTSILVFAVDDKGAAEFAYNGSAWIPIAWSGSAAPV